MRRAWLAPSVALALTAAFAACDGDDTPAGGGGDAGPVDATVSEGGSSSGASDGAADGDGSIPPTPAPFGLDTRPPNPNCVAKDRPPQGGDVDLVEYYPNLPVPRFAYPVHMTKAPGDPTKFYVSEQDPGDGSSVIKKLENDSTTTTSSVFLQIPAGTLKRGSAEEGGLLSMAFDPGWQANRTAYIAFTIDPPGPNPMATVIARVKSTDGGNTLNWSTREDILTLEKPEDNHNGGLILFGPDGNLYFGMGDGGGGNDPYQNGQKLTTMLGKMLRIKVGPNGPYTIPADNPFAAGGGRPEIYAWGLRNPWRFSFDRATGDLWLGDVGETRLEEINVIQKGGNYGWSVFEASECLNGPCNTPGLIPPVHEYPHTGTAAVVGGYVYRGTKIPSLVGKYVFADTYYGTLWTLDTDPVTGAYKSRVIYQDGVTSFPVSFTEDEEGELFVLGLIPGRVYKMVPKTASPPDTFPKKLSETGCFDAADPKKPAPGLVPYAPVAPFWSDGADKQRWIAVPDGKTVAVGPDGDFDFPNGTVLAKEFRLGGKRIETRLFMRHDDGNWGGYSYEWNDAETDATLVPFGGKNKAIAGQTWSYPSRGQCLQCHTAAAGRSLSLETLQLNSDFVYTSTNRISNQLATLDHIGLFASPIGDPKAKPKLPDPFGPDPVEARARAYLHSNCSHCHRPSGTGRGPANFLFTTAAADLGVCNVDPTQGTLGIAGAKLVATGDPGKSVVSARMKRLDAHRMPPIGTRVVDPKGTALVDAWITGKTTCP
ncbi:MAG: PQQ-dependent sugar dehydrogenase [Myxococcales bacterium]|nr:PQQ-dependent sugar dehydrogenase [Myxococcales bacterium]